MSESMLPAILVPLCAYLLGSILPAEILARRRGVDLRETGKNPGTAETGRLFGLGSAILVFALDAAKGILPLLAGWSLGVPAWSLILTAAMAIAGHNWSIYYGFWGGQGLATVAGVYMYLLPQAFFVALVPSMFAWWKTKWVPSSGIVGLPAVGVLAWMFNADPSRRATVVLVSIVMLIRQRDWIRQRLAESSARRQAGRPASR